MAEQRSQDGGSAGGAAPPFEALVVAHGAAVLRVCRALLGPHDADDAWSETFLAALAAYPRLPLDADRGAWLTTIAHRKAIDVLRARARHAVPMADPPDAPTRLGLPGDDDLDLVAAVRRLPPRQRDAVALHHLGGLPHRAVADLIGGTPEAARRASADGIRALRAAHSEGALS